MVEKLVNDSFAEAVKDEKLDVVASPSVSLADNDLRRREAAQVHGPRRGEAE